MKCTGTIRKAQHPPDTIVDTGRTMSYLNTKHTLHGSVEGLQQSLTTPYPSESQQTITKGLIGLVDV